MAEQPAVAVVTFLPSARQRRWHAATVALAASTLLVLAVGWQLSTLRIEREAAVASRDQRIHAQLLLALAITSERLGRAQAEHRTVSIPGDETMKPTLRRCGLLLAGWLPVLAAAQAGKLVIPDFNDLAKKATDTVDITLDGDMLKSASHMVGAGDADLSGVVAGLKAITVRSFMFDKPGMYSPEAVAGVLSQVDNPDWKKIISVRNKGQRVEIHMRENSEDGGLLIVTEEALQLTIVNIAGKISLDQLRQLQGHMGVPSLPGAIGTAPPAPPPPPAPPAPIHGP